MEMLIVVAIIAILIAVAIPVFGAQLHKARVATDWANLRSFYADIQTDYMTTGEQNPKVPVDWHSSKDYDWHSVTFLNGQKVKMKAGRCAVSFTEDEGYSIVTTGTQRAILACLQNNILFRRLCTFYVQSFFAEKQTLKT